MRRQFTTLILIGGTLLSSSCSTTLSKEQKKWLSFAGGALIGGAVGAEVSKDHKAPNTNKLLHAGGFASASYILADQLIEDKNETEMKLRDELEFMKKTDTSSDDFFYKKNLEKLKEVANVDCLENDKTTIVCSDDNGNFINCKKMDLFPVSKHWAGQYNFFYSKDGCFKEKSEQPELKEYLEKNLKGVNK